MITLSFEQSVAELITPSHAILDLSKEWRDKLLEPDSLYKQGGASLCYMQLVLDNVQRSSVGGAVLSRRRLAPLAPNDFNALVARKTFTNGTDREKIVIPRYLNTFHRVIACARSLDYSSLLEQTTGE